MLPGDEAVLLQVTHPRERRVGAGAEKDPADVRVPESLVDVVGVVVVVDVLRFSTTVTDAVSRGETVALDAAAHAVSLNGARVAAAASDSLVLMGCLRNASAAAAAVLAALRRAQEQRSPREPRASVAVIACGALRQAQEPPGRGRDADLRFAVEDQLGAGAIVDALAAGGIDHSSPEAAAACESFRGLRGAVRHLLTASGSGQELIELGRRDEVLNASAIDATDAVPMLRDGTFVPFSTPTIV